MTRDNLCAAKFLKDAKGCRTAGTTMAGNVLDEDGMVGTQGRHHPDLIPREQYLWHFMSQTILSIDWTPTVTWESEALPPITTMKSVISHIRDQVRKDDEFRKLMTNRAKRLRFRRSLQRMLAAYVDNPGMHSIDLQAAVHRQGIFVAKMAHLDWLHSPNATNTMTSLIEKYDEWFGLIRAHPGKLLVPTLDVDLAWHTAQLSPWRYYIKTTTMLGRYLNHDDKIADTKLSDAFAETTKLYEKTYGKEYSSCTCWYCESESAVVITDVAC